MTPRPALFLPQHVARYGASTNMPLSHVINVDAQVNAATASSARNAVIAPEDIDACLMLGFTADAAVTDQVGERPPRGWA